MTEPSASSDDTVARALDQLASLLSQVSADDLDRPTPCSQWSVAKLSDHVVLCAQHMATMANGGQVDWTAPTPHVDDAAAAFAQHTAALKEAISSGGQVPLGMVAAEFAVHAYDLATGLGTDTSSLDQSVAETGYDFMSANLTDDQRGEAFAPAQPAPDGANAYQRLAAFAGRTVRD